MKKFFTVLAVLCTALTMSYAQDNISVGEINGTSNFLTLKDHKVYYEVFGQGDPLLILHGNGGSTKGKHRLLSKLTDKYQVILMDNRCHGQSGCPEGELTYLKMADDTNALMQHLGHEKYYIWGHSDGGIVSLILGYKYPAQIDRMLVTGANIRPDTTALQNRLVELMGIYPQIPDPMMSKHIELMVKHPNIPISKIKEINVPVLLMVGDRDAVKLEHTVEIFKALPKANLCIMPGTTHFIDSEKPDQLIYWLNEFKKPFKAPSTVAIMEEYAKSLSGH
ncbi:alpha/beta fold hydrolase [Fulvivirga lutimaris]|uniref:alpha/beta fold hydrolase n=1 Tax=Fulvivirga lutimaris TaxID=1819566 RepID=UPI00162759C1|nr:alpha/beta hydrolase [Fulvivirga lutimaris]